MDLRKSFIENLNLQGKNIVMADPDKQCRCGSCPMLLKISPQCTNCYHWAGTYCCTFELVQEKGGRKNDGEKRKTQDSYTFSEGAALPLGTRLEALTTAEPQLDPASNPPPVRHQFTPVGQQVAGIPNFGPPSPPLRFGHATSESLIDFDFDTNTIGAPAAVGESPSDNALLEPFEFDPQLVDEVADTSATPWDTVYHEGLEESASYKGPNTADPYQSPFSKELAPQHIAALQRSRDQSSTAFPPNGTGTPIAPAQITAEPRAHGSAATQPMRRVQAHVDASRKGAGPRNVPGKPEARASPCTVLTESPSFACPYVLHNPKKYRSCRTKTLRRIRDVKQHIRREHKQPEDPEGVTAEQGSSLGRKPGSGTYKDLEAQWYLIWDIVFPHRVQERPSSPYQPDDITLLTASIQKNGKKFIMSHPRFGYLASNLDDTISAFLAMIAEFEGRDPHPKPPDLFTHLLPPDSEESFGFLPSESDVMAGVGSFYPDEEEFCSVPQDLGWDSSNIQEMLLGLNYQRKPLDHRT